MIPEEWTAPGAVMSPCIAIVNRDECSTCGERTTPGVSMSHPLVNPKPHSDAQHNGELYMAGTRELLPHTHLLLEVVD